MALFESLSDRLNHIFSKLRNKGKLTELEIKQAMREIRVALLEADVNYNVVKDFTAKVSEKALGEDILKSLTPAQQIVKIVNDELCALMGSTHQKLAVSDKQPTIYMMCGLQGAGKTTMVNLLMRFFEVNSGRITIDGVATTDLRREDVHELFGMVLQDTWLFEGTIRENLVYNMEGITDEQLETVCKACGLDKFVHSLPQGFDTVLSESTTISAGQKQLLTIARAMLQNAPMLILDEATSSVDTRTELLIQRAMDELTKGRTSFVIAHRLSTIKNADLILVMRDGDVIESGTHEQLMEQNGFYAELYNSQFAQAS